MAVATGTVLSLVLGDRTAVLAQVGLDKGGRVVQRVGHFDTTAARLLEAPKANGEALAAYLSGHGFSAKKAVVGVPARWLIAQERDLPPVDVNAANDLLRLAAERLSLAESGTLVADYAGQVDTKSPSKVLLVGMLKPQLDKVRTFIEAAGLQIAAVCPTSLAIADVTGGNKNVLHLGADGAELVLQTNGNPRTLQPLTPDLAALGPELRRTLAMRGVAASDLTLSDSVGLTDEQAAGITSKLTTATTRFGQELGVTLSPGAHNGSAKTLSAEAHWPAVALAVSAATKRGLPIDFADSKLTYRPPAKFGQRTILGVAAGVLAVLGFGWLVMTVNAREAEEKTLAQLVADKKQPLVDAKADIDQITYGRTYFDTRPNMLECIKQIALAFNFEEQIWLNSVDLKLDGRCVINGRSVDRQNDLSLINALRARLATNPSFKNVTVSSTSDTGSGSGQNREQLKAFTIGLLYQPQAATTAPTTKPSK